MKIAFFEIEEWEQKRIEKSMQEAELLFFPESLTKEQVERVQDCDIISVFIHSQITEDLLGALTSLKCIVTRSTGFDHIDLGAAEKAGVAVYNVPSYGEHTVAEHTFGLLLSLSRNIHQSHMRRLRNNFSIEGLKGFDLCGKTFGVIGTGKIGKNVISIAQAFGMNVIAYDAFPDEEHSKNNGYQYASLEDLLRQSDIISLHAPATPETYHLINKENISLLKRGAVLINTARGELVANDALLWALEQGILVGCGLDVLEGENLIREEKELLYKQELNAEAMAELVKDHVLLSREEVVYTPHLAFFSQEALERIVDTTVENIQNYLAGNFKNRVGN